MRTTTLLIGVISIVAVSAYHSEAFGGQMRIVHSIPFPGVAEFGCDIAWDGQYIWTAFYETPTVPTEGGGTWTPRVRSFDPVDGSPGPSFPFGQGLDNRSGIVWDGTHLWVTRTSGISGTPAQTIPDYIYKFEPDGTEAASFELPGSPDISATGLAFDGTYLWVSDARHDRLLQVHRHDMSVVKSFASPGSIPLGLAWDGSSLWSVDGETNNIFQIDTSGNVLETWSIPLAQPFGITFDGEYFWVLNNAPRSINQLVVPEPRTLTLTAVGCASVFLFVSRFGKLSPFFSEEIKS